MSFRFGFMPHRTQPRTPGCSTIPEEKCSPVGQKRGLSGPDDDSRTLTTELGRRPMNFEAFDVDGTLEFRLDSIEFQSSASASEQQRRSLVASIERRSGKRGDAYVVRFRDAQGKSRSKTFHRRDEAQLFASTTDVQVRTGDWIDPNAGRVKFGKFHARWAAARDVSPSRADAEASQARCHILPEWQSVALNAIRPLEVDRWLKDIDAGPHTKVEVLAQFKQCLDAAVREGLIRVNPAAATRPPSKPKKRVTQLDVLDAHEIDLLVKTMPDRWKALVFLSAWLGWRWSEAMGLCWRDVDLEAGRIYLGNETVVESRGTQYVNRGGKTTAATRTVPLPGPALSVLRWHRERFAVGRMANDRVFLSAPCPPPGAHAVRRRKGGCQTPGECIGHTPFRSNFRRIFQKAVTDAGLDGRGISIRQLRHTAASLMLANGLDVLDVQERLGHTRGSVTLDIYGRLLMGRREAANEQLGSAMESVVDISFASPSPALPTDPGGGRSRDL